MTCVAIISGSRADAGALHAVKEALGRAGVAIRWFSIPCYTLSQDSCLIVASEAAMACEDTAKELARHPVDLVLLHGDRYEILGAATAAFLLGLPIVHLGGGDVTEGSQDDSMRHSITKLSHLHFATCADSARRLVQLGEHPSRVFNVGDLGVDLLVNGFHPYPRDLTLSWLGIGTASYFLVVLHPNTLGSTQKDLSEVTDFVTAALCQGLSTSAVLLRPNRDAGNALIDREFKRLVKTLPNCKYFVNMDQRLFLSALKHADKFVGNSSAAYYEAPALGIPTVIIGDRQKGRQQIQYSDGKACHRIVEILKGINPKDLLCKQFYNVEAECLTNVGKKYILQGNGDAIRKRNSSDGLPEIITECPTDHQYTFWI